MGDAVEVFLLTLSALFPIVDPLAGSPLFSGHDPGLCAANAKGAGLARFLK